MAAPKVTVRLTRTLHALVTEEAEREGVSAAEFIRSAAIAFAAHSRGQRGEPLLTEPRSPDHQATTQRPRRR